MASQGLPVVLDLEKSVRSTGRPRISREIREFIRTMSEANALWGAPRIHSELLKLGIDVSQATVAKYMVRHPKPPSQAWRAFLKKHTKQLASIDFITVPTLTFRILYVFVVLTHERRRVIHFNVTSHPMAEWTSQQLLQAFHYDTAPQYVLRNRDRLYGEDVRRQLNVIEQILTAPRSPWQSPYVERLIGPIRRDCLDHIIVINEELLRAAALRSYFSYYHDSRCHLALDKDSPDSRETQLPERGVVVEISKVGGLHHRYELTGSLIALSLSHVRQSHTEGWHAESSSIPNILFSTLSRVPQPILTSHMRPRSGLDVLRSAWMDFPEGTFSIC